MNLFDEKITVLSLIMVEQGPSAPQHYRPYAVNTKDRVSLTARWKKFLNDNRDKITPELLGELTYDTLTPAVEKGDVADIPNGWESPRFSFALTFMEENPFSKKLRVAYGYTDYVGTSNGSVDPNMRFYFNRLVTHNSDHITVHHYHDLYNKKLHSITPQGLFHLKQTHEVTKALKNIKPKPWETSEAWRIGRSFDTRNIHFLAEPDNAIPAKYLCDTVNAYRDALTEIKGTNHEGDREILYSEAAASVDPGDRHCDDFYNKLRDNSEVGRKKYVTYGELEKMFTGLDDRTLISINQDFSNPVETDSESQWAVVLKHAIPALMASAGLRRIHFSVAYDAEQRGGYHIQEEKTSWIFDFPEGGRTSTESVVTQLMTEVLNSFEEFTDGGKVMVNADLAGQTTIEISMDGSAWEKHVVPTYCDSQFPPYLSQQSTEDYMENLFGLIEPGM